MNNYYIDNVLHMLLLREQPGKEKVPWLVNQSKSGTHLSIHWIEFVKCHDITMFLFSIYSAQQDIIETSESSGDAMWRSQHRNTASHYAPSSANQGHKWVWPFWVIVYKLPGQNVYYHFPMLPGMKLTHSSIHTPRHEFMK